MGKPEAVGCARLKEGKDYLLAFLSKGLQRNASTVQLGHGFAGQDKSGMLIFENMLCYLSAWDWMYGSLGRM
jgi:hypothetical protein